MENEELDEALRAYTEGAATLTQAVTGYAAAVRHAAIVVGVELAAVDVGTGAEPVQLVLHLAAAPELHIEWNPVLGWFHSPAPMPGDPPGQPHEITYRAGDENDAADLAPDADIVAAWLAVLATGDRSGHPEPPERAAAADPGLLAQLALHAHPRGHPGAPGPAPD